MIKPPGLPIVQTPHGPRINMPGVKYPEYSIRRIHSARKSIPPGYSGTRQLSAETGFSMHYCRVTLRRLAPGIWVRPPTGHPYKAWHKATALKHLRARAAARCAPLDAPPPGYCTTAEAMNILQCSRTTLQVHAQRGHLQPLRGHAPGSVSPRLFFRIDACHTLAKTRTNQNNGLLQHRTTRR